MLPLLMGVFPFALAYGVAVAESSVADWVGGVASLVVFAGAAQMALLNLVDSGAPWTIALLTALVVNLRLVMYSAALAPSFREYPTRWRIPLAHLIADLNTVTSLLYNERDTNPMRRMYFYLGTGVIFLATWVGGSVAGILLGAAVPAELQLEFAIPLVFVALLMASVRDRASFLAAAVGLSVTLLAKDAPLNAGLLIGACCGIAIGYSARRR